jgi:hypothetical protein
MRDRADKGERHPDADQPEVGRSGGFAGTCYKAANWKCLGQTTGRGIKNKTQAVLLSLKDVLGYPLCRDFREKLCGEKPL